MTVTPQKSPFTLMPVLVGRAERSFTRILNSDGHHKWMLSIGRKWDVCTPTRGNDGRQGVRIGRGFVHTSPSPPSLTLPHQLYLPYQRHFSFALNPHRSLCAPCIDYFKREMSGSTVIIVSQQTAATLTRCTRTHTKHMHNNGGKKELST